NEGKYKDVVSECERLKEELKSLRDEHAERKDAQKKSEIALKEAKAKQTILTQRNQSLIEEIESKNHSLSCRVKDARRSAEELSSVSEQLSQLYHHACLAVGDTPQRVVLDSIRKETKQIEQKSSENKEIEADESQDKENTVSAGTAEFSSDTVTTTTVLSTMRDQLKYLRSSIEKLAATKDTLSSVTLALLPGQTSLAESQEQVRQLEEEVLRLRSLLSSKREQIATLRTVLKANKHTAE
uniref:Uncharacterized protein n=1 Tax=Ciona savignyi TaxID=51511 RepID=H2ZKX1_CIOSA